MTRAVLQRQRGAALFVVMVMLVVLAWFSMSAYRMSAQNMQIVDNGQTRQQATAAAQRAIEATISNNLFATNPAATAATPIATDVDGDGTPDFTAMITPAPTCYRMHTVKTSELTAVTDPTYCVNHPNDRDCPCLQSSGTTGNALVEQVGAASRAGDSMCADTEWDIASRVNDARTASSVTVHQGVALRVLETDATSYCK